MTVLVLGASGATGRLLVQDLLKNDFKVKAIVRDEQIFLTKVQKTDNLEIIENSILDISEKELIFYINDCDAIACCLGHTLNLKGIFGKPFDLVTKSIKNLCQAVIKSKKENVKLVLMNTSGNTNRDINEKVSLSQRCVVSLVRFLVPPHADNENAADYLRIEIGQDNKSIQWVIVRPDSLVNEDVVSLYENFSSPTRSAIFNAGKTSRINVADFMSRLIREKELFNKWQGQMPLIYNEK